MTRRTSSSRFGPTLFSTVIGCLTMASLACDALPGQTEDASTTAVGGPIYDDPAAREIVERMVEAHGGLERWRSAPSVGYDNYFLNPSWKQSGWSAPWWVSSEITEQSTGRSYHRWPLRDAEIGYDGETVWSRNFRLGNPPKFQVHFFYYFVGLPWVTQNPGVRLTSEGTGELPGFDQSFDVVRLEFTDKPTVGKSARDGYRLYIDREDHLLRGYEYWVGWGPMLDIMRVPEGGVFGPMLRVHDSFTRVDGLVLPAAFHTMPPDGSVTYGHHLILNYRFDESFDPSRVEMPVNGIVDETEDVRG